MTCRCSVSVMIWCMLIGGGLAFSPVAAQSPEREYVIAVGDQLDIQVFNQVQALANFSAGVEVRSDRMITMPWLGDVKVAGLKKSTLTTLLESQEYLGEYLTEPHVTITPTGMAAAIIVMFRGVVDTEQELPRDTKFGQLLREVAASLQQYDPNLDAISIKSAEGEVFAADQNLRLQWGDEIVVPAAAPTPTPVASKATPLPSGAVQPVAQFSEEEYQAFQAFMEDYPEVYEQLLPLVRHEDDATFIDLANLTDEQQAQLPQAVIDELRRYLPKSGQPLETGIALLGIRVNLMIEGLQDAFLAFPQAEGGTLIRRFQEGDVVQPAENGSDDLILFEVNETDQRVILEQGDEQQTIPMTPPLSDIALVGILTNSQGDPEAILQGVSAVEVPEVPTQRKRYEEGAEVTAGVTLVKIIEDQQLAVLQDENQAVQVLLLRDPNRRATAAQPSAEQSSASPSPDMEQSVTPPLTGLPEGELPGVIHEQVAGSMLKEQMPEQFQALDTLSQLFFATPLF